MADMEKLNIPENDALQFVKESASIGLKVAEPLQKDNERLTEIIKHQQITFRIVVGILGAVLALFIALAYLSPAEMEQSQNLPEQTQSQATKGVN